MDVCSASLASKQTSKAATYMSFPLAGVGIQIVALEGESCGISASVFWINHSGFSMYILVSGNSEAGDCVLATRRKCSRVTFRQLFLVCVCGTSLLGLSWLLDTLPLLNTHVSIDVLICVSHPERLYQVHTQNVSISSTPGTSISHPQPTSQHREPHTSVPRNHAAARTKTAPRIW